MIIIGALLLVAGILIGLFLAKTKEEPLVIIGVIVIVFSVAINLYLNK